MLNELRRHIGGRRWHDVNEDEIKQFCRSRTNPDLLAVHNFGNTALILIRAWSGPPEASIASWVGEANPDQQPPIDLTPPSATSPPVLYVLPRLHALRVQAELDIRQLARAADLPVGTVAKAEQCRQRASPATIGKLVSALGIEPSELVGEPDQ